MLKFKNNLITLFAAVVFASAAIFPVLQDQKVSSLSGSQFKPGYIISDTIFYNGDGMSASQIQSFLNSKVPHCDTNGDKPYGGTTRKQYSASKGVSTPFICLKSYKQNTPAKAAESGLCSSLTAKTGRKAALIIYDVAKACGISPKVLIVLLEKEQSLVTDDWPWPIQYRSATGYGCPDTAACDSQYYGFFNQVYNAAKQFKRYKANPNNYNYRAGTNNFIQWHPNGGCGGSTVFIQNTATAGLYNYTPYRPNAAALNNLYGTGDSCSSYGNRNFWRIFNDWFKSTVKPPYKAQLLGSSDLTGIKPGMSKQVYLVYQNVGTETWCGLDAPVSEFCPFGGDPPAVLASTKPLYSPSPFSGMWERSDRPLLNFTRVHASNGNEAVGQKYVRPTQRAVFVFNMVGPMNLKSNTLYNEWFEPIVQHSTTMYTQNRLQLKTPSLSLNSKRVWSNSQRNAKPGWQLITTVKLKNTGNVVWYDHNSALPGVRPLVLSTAKSSGNSSVFGANYETQARATSELLRVEDFFGNPAASQDKVLPGHSAVFQFTMTIPNNMQPGVYSEWLGLRFAGMPNLKAGFDIELKIRVWPND